MRSPGNCEEPAEAHPETGQGAERSACRVPERDDPGLRGSGVVAVLTPPSGREKAWGLPGGMPFP